MACAHTLSRTLLMLSISFSRAPELKSQFRRAYTHTHTLRLRRRIVWWTSFANGGSTIDKYRQMVYTQKYINLLGWDSQPRIINVQSTVRRDDFDGILCCVTIVHCAWHALHVHSFCKSFYSIKVSFRLCFYSLYSFDLQRIRNGFSVAIEDSA